MLRSIAASRSLIRSAFQQFPVRSVSTVTNRVFVDSFDIHNSTGLISIKPIKPIFKTSKPGVTVVDSQGTVSIDFIPTLSDSTEEVKKGEKKYNYSQREVIRLNIFDVGRVLTHDFRQPLRFIRYHGPGTASNGPVKTFTITKADKGGFNFAFKTANGLDLSLPVAESDFFIVRSLLNSFMPSMLGWYAIANPALAMPEEAASSSD
eukprot:GILI01013691.1.p1 GENE.GILI01013691.1~~GILI01013691.1.p1  ORF type:complete len:206 (+),score=53.44 GILI01013691.1:47-664(+)